MPGFLDAFTKFYKPAAGTDLFKAECATCHGKEGHSVKNPYGKEVMAVVQARNTLVLTDDMLISIENKDADGDGYTNLEEIVSGKLPGDPASHPSAHPDPKTLPKRPAHLPLTQLGAGLLAVVAGVWAVVARKRGRRLSSQSKNEVGS